jgi:hypothetical protein
MGGADSTFEYDSRDNMGYGIPVDDIEVFIPWLGSYIEKVSEVNKRWGELSKDVGGISQGF